ncbi:MAG TPA: ABC transporter substrate-binding protein [Thermomicrobiales bacterium]|nr:ABC transporter substrate-binding protein [Thermomicrobiales bacterium]
MSREDGIPDSPGVAGPRRWRRRDFVRRAAVLGAASPALAALLAACGTSSTPTAAPGAPAATGAAKSAAGSAGAASPTPVRGGDLVEASGGPEPDTLDPQLTGYQITANLAVQYLDSLVREDGNYKFWPNLAERWEVSPDATVYTFYLKKNVVFHDGTPFNAEAVRVNFDRIADPATQSKMAVQYLGPYDKTEVVDGTTVKVHFKSPYADFLDAAARSLLGIISPAALQKYGKDIGRNPVGTGYFTFKEWIPNKSITFERNERYAWGSPAFGRPGPAALDSFKLAVLVDSATALAAFDRGEVQLGPLANTDVQKYTGKPNVQILRRVYAGFPRCVFMNVDKPPTDDIRVRKACIYATNPDAIIKISLADLTKPAHGPLSSVTPGYDKSVETLYKYDPDMAKKLLDEAGWQPGSDGIRQKNGQRLSLSCIVNAGWDPYTVPLQAMLKAVGIDMQIQTLSSAARVEANSRGDGNLAPLGADSSSPRILDITFHSHSIEKGWAWSRYRSKELDDLIDKAAGQVDQAQRNQTYSQIQKIIMDNALIIPLVENTYFTVLSGAVHDVPLDAQGYPWLHDTWLAR